MWIPGLTDVVALSVADFSMCAIRSDGSTWCWGMNDAGQLDVTTAECFALGYECSDVPVLSGIEGAGQIAGGAKSFCAVSAAGGALQCWGSGDIWDAAGYQVLSTAVGLENTCVRFQPAPGDDPTRNVACDGPSDQGQLGSGALPGMGPVAGGNDGGFVEIAAGMDFACGVDAASGLYCWGSNVFAGLGVGDEGDNSDLPMSCPNSGGCSLAPMRVTGLPPVAHVAAHYTQACALAVDGTVYCWGTPSHTSPASASACWSMAPGCVPTPAVVPGVPPAATIGVGYGHACVITVAGDVYCWGLDTHGQLGRGDGAPPWDMTPMKVEIPPEPQ